MRPTRREFTDRNQGSAYLMTLLAMVVLTIVALSLSVVTQTERLLGANDRITQRIFYAADSGTAVSTARVLAQNNHEEVVFELNRDTAAADTNFTERVSTSRFHPILASPCNYCEINQGSRFFNVNHAITAAAERIGWQGGGPPPADARVLARKTVAEMVALQPWQVTLAGDILPSLASEQLKKIKF